MASNRKGSNLSPIAAGLAAVRGGFETVEQGAAHIAAGIADSWEGSFRWSYGSGDSETSGLTSLATMFLPVTGENGKVDGKVLPAIYNALPDVFGIEWGDDRTMQSKLKMTFLRAWRIAAAKAVGVDVKFEGKAVSVPLSVAYDLSEVNDKDEVVLSKLGKEIAERIKVNAEMEGKVLTDVQVQERMNKMRVTCKGGNHPVFGDVPSVTKIADRLVPSIVKAGLMPAPKARAARADSGVQFVSSLDFVTECMALLTGNGDESKFAPTDETEAKLRKCAELIAAYFANATN